MRLQQLLAQADLYRELGLPIPLDLAAALIDLGVILPD